MCTQAAGVLMDVHNLKAELVLVPGPDPSRISAFQQDKEYATNLKKPIGAFPCRVTGSAGQQCSFHFFTMQAHSNAHMKKKHGLVDKDARLYPPAKEQKEFPCKESDCGASFKTVAGANNHLVKKHGYAENSVDLYVDMSSTSKPGKRKRSTTTASAPEVSAFSASVSPEPAGRRLRPRTTVVSYQDSGEEDADGEDSVSKDGGAAALQGENTVTEPPVEEENEYTAKREKRIHENNEKLRQLVPGIKLQLRATQTSKKAGAGEDEAEDKEYVPSDNSNNEGEGDEEEENAQEPARGGKCTATGATASSSEEECERDEGQPAIKTHLLVIVLWRECN